MFQYPQDAQAFINSQSPRQVPYELQNQRYNSQQQQPNFYINQQQQQQGQQQPFLQQQYQQYSSQPQYGQSLQQRENFQQQQQPFQQYQPYQQQINQQPQNQIQRQGKLIDRLLVQSQSFPQQLPTQTQVANRPIIQNQDRVVRINTPLSQPPPFQQAQFSSPQQQPSMQKYQYPQIYEPQQQKLSQQPQNIPLQFQNYNLQPQQQQQGRYYSDPRIISNNQTQFPQQIPIQQKLVPPFQRYPIPINQVQKIPVQLAHSVRHVDDQLDREVTVLEYRPSQVPLKASNVANRYLPQKYDVDRIRNAIQDSDELLSMSK